MATIQEIAALAIEVARQLGVCQIDLTLRMKPPGEEDGASNMSAAGGQGRFAPVEKGSVSALQVSVDCRTDEVDFSVRVKALIEQYIIAHDYPARHDLLCSAGREVETASFGKGQVDILIEIRPGQRKWKMDLDVIQIQRALYSRTYHSDALGIDMFSNIRIDG